MAWTDDELRAAIHEAAVAEGHSISIEHGHSHSAKIIRNREVHDLRRLLTALGIDHQPKPELPDTPGSVIYDVVDNRGYTYRVMQKGLFGWYGVNEKNGLEGCADDEIVSFGGVLDLDKIRGEQGE